MNPDNTPANGHRRPLIQRLGAVLWPSFFAAGVAAAVFFSMVDPLALAHISFPDHSISRELGYSAGFLLLWLATASASAFTSLLLRPRADELRDEELE
ncbi:hypothetical protein [Stenotrophomonas sp.]|uniref:hypothetical protein n=1 Tax=Stenotrophomonas sp. TaxID=69392 RepID=UPI0028AA0A28|nr:hypothetical protein [Stenotrophomonas sp.]